MLKAIELPELNGAGDSVAADVVHVCLLIPPLWDLKNYVAVNPFLGFAGESIQTAASRVSEGLGADVLPSIDYYRSRWSAGDFDSADLKAAAGRAGRNVGQLEAVLTGHSTAPVRLTRGVCSFAERHDREHGTDWHGEIIRSAARWCAVYAARGGSYWRMPEGAGLFASWREAAAADRSLEIMGLRGIRSWAAGLPPQPDAAIAAMLGRLEVTACDRVAYLYRLLGGLYGWASYFRRFAWERDTQDPGQVVDVLAIRICLDAAVARLAGPATRSVVVHVPPAIEDESARLVLQDALEDRFIRRLAEKILPPPTGCPFARPAVQAVFCIDVRSEPLRRHLESVSPEIQTRGFAGFFGVALNWRTDDGDSARCPVLLKPGIQLNGTCNSDRNQFAAAKLHLQAAPAAAFSFVEVLGMTYGVRLASDGIVAGSAPASPEGADSFTLAPDCHGAGIPVAARVDLAAGILKNMGFTDSFARLVLLCGHEGHSANNPHTAGLDCGACGGHGGAINARVAAALLNDSHVRAALVERGWSIPADTHFLPGVHDTSIDEVRLLDTDHIPASHAADVDRLRAQLDHAGACVRSERATALGLAHKPAGLLDRLLRRRARDWSEVRPEWALARNAAFIAARRSRTRGADLEGRAFLHEYDASTDADDSVLTLILSAPMVVASWINLQYLASTVDNATFGAGDKAIHNRVGTLGVVLGNGGDLRTGLARQSVHGADGRWHHEPLRLQVIVEATHDRIDRVLAAQLGVRDLVENGWVRLFALDPHGESFARFIPGRGWENL